VNLPSGGTKAELEVEALGRAYSAATARKELTPVRPLPHVFAEKLYRLPSEASALIRRIDHEAPEEVVAELPRLGPETLIVQHQEAHRMVAGVDGAKPSLGMKMRFGDRLCVRRYERPLSFRDV
jgi:hypothetical protein